MRNNSIIPDLTFYSQQAVLKSLSVFFSSLYTVTKDTVTNENNKEPKLPFCLIDATAGNGYDTLFMAEALNKLGIDKSVLVHAFDIQEQALKNTALRLDQSGCLERSRLYLKSHAFLKTTLLDFFNELKIKSSVAIAMFNLGFLPRSDKQIITKADSTLVALEQLCAKPSKAGNFVEAEACCPLIVPNGLISIHCYAGHTGGEDETQAVLNYVKALDSRIWKVLLYEELNKYRNRELLILVERLK